MSARRRLEALEGRARLHQCVSEGSTRARARMVEHLGQMAKLKRGELGPEEAAEVEALTVVVEARLASRRGEGA